MILLADAKNDGDYINGELIHIFKFDAIGNLYECWSGAGWLIGWISPETFQVLRNGTPIPQHKNRSVVIDTAGNFR